jgi:hypothetical protein
MTTGFLVGKPEGERILARPRRGWEYNIKVSLKEMRWNDVDRFTCLCVGRIGGLL